jgi:hypothetical protein
LLVLLQKLRAGLKAELGALYPLLLLKPIEAAAPDSPHAMVMAAEGLLHVCSHPQVQAAGTGLPLASAVCLQCGFVSKCGGWSATGPLRPAHALLWLPHALGWALDSSCIKCPPSWSCAQLLLPVSLFSFLCLSLPLSTCLSFSVPQLNAHFPHPSPSTGSLLSLPLQVLVDLFVNYDCSLQAANLYERTIKAVRKLTALQEPNPQFSPAVTQASRQPTTCKHAGMQPCRLLLIVTVTISVCLSPGAPLSGRAHMHVHRASTPWRHSPLTVPFFFLFLFSLQKLKATALKALLAAIQSLDTWAGPIKSAAAAVALTPEDAASAVAASHSGELSGDRSEGGAASPLPRDREVRGASLLLCLACVHCFIGHGLTCVAWAGYAANRTAWVTQRMHACVPCCE